MTTEGDPAWSVPYDIRPFATTAEYHACVDLQEDTWGQGFSERVAPAILKVAQILGGVSAGAYDAEGALMGFVFGMTGVRDGEVVHWSDMLAVRPAARDHGLGRRLKAYQRDQVLAHGVTKMFWTFDPLQSRNAHLNLSRLGIVVREYAEDMYGQTDSPLHRGIGTDRFIALWLLRSERVVERMRGEGRDDAVTGGSAPVALAADGTGRLPRPRTPDLSLDAPALAVQIPSDVAALMGADISLAQDWRAATRAAFTHYLAGGYEVSGFRRGSRTSTYLVTRRAE